MCALIVFGACFRYRCRSVISVLIAVPYNKLFPVIIGVRHSGIIPTWFVIIFIRAGLQLNTGYIAGKFITVCRRPVADQHDRIAGTGFSYQYRRRMQTRLYICAPCGIRLIIIVCVDAVNTAVQDVCIVGIILNDGCGFIICNNCDLCICFEYLADKLLCRFFGFLHSYFSVAVFIAHASGAIHYNDDIIRPALIPLYCQVDLPFVFSG